MTEGYILVAIGEDYEKMATKFVDTLRKHGDYREVTVVTGYEQVDVGLLYYADTPFEAWGTIPKICLNKFLKYDHNIFVDSDVLCIGDTEHVWDIVKSQDNFIYQLGIPEDLTFNRGMAAESAKKHGWGIPPRVQGGFIYLNRNKLDEEFFTWMQDEAFLYYEKYFPWERRYKGSRTDQCIYSMAHAKFNLPVLNMMENPVMTFMEKYEPLPTNKVYFKGRESVLNKNVAFAHMMGSCKPGLPGYDKVYQEILNV